MAIQMLATNTRRLSWFLHPIDRLRANLAANKIGQYMQRQAAPLTTAFVDQFLSHNALAARAAFLRSVGVVQITKSDGSLANGYLSAQEKQVHPTATEKMKLGKIAVVQVTPRDEDLPVMRQFVSLEHQAGQPTAVSQWVTEMFPGEDVRSYNMSLMPAATGYGSNYFGPGRIVNAGKPGEKNPLEGELSVLQAVSPKPLPSLAGTTVVYDSHKDSIFYQADMPQVILKDETRATTPLGLATGGLMGGINFGLKRLYHLVLDNARYILANVPARVRDNYSVYLGKSNRYIKFFGQLMVGERTLAEVTNGDKAPQYMIITKPLNLDEAEKEPKQIALVDKKSGKVKYVLPTAVWSAHVANLKVKMGAKFAHGMRAEELSAALSQIRETTSLTAEESAQLRVFEDAAKQTDLWDTADEQRAEWVFMEVVPGSFVSQKPWLDRLNTELHNLSEKYKGIRAGKEMARVLRENGNLYNLEDLVYLAMFSSDRGTFAAGFVGKFSKLTGMIDPEFLGELYDTIRGKAAKDGQPAKGIFEGTKIYAINMGEAAEVISFSDEKAGKSGIRKGEYNYAAVINATVDYSRDKAEEWTYWRQALGIPTTRTVEQGSYVGARHWWNPTTWHNRFRRDQVIIDSTISANLLPRGKAYIIGSNLEAAERVAVGGPLFSIWSHATIGRGVERNVHGLLLYGYDNNGPAVGESVIGASGLYATYSAQKPLPGSGLMVSSDQIQVEFPRPGDKRVVETAKAAIDQRNAQINGALSTLSPDATAKRESELLNQNLAALREVI